MAISPGNVRVLRHRAIAALRRCLDAGATVEAERMTDSCAHPIPWATLVDYWAGDLDEAETATLDEHLFGCAACSATSARVAAVTEAVREALPAVVSRARVDRLRGPAACASARTPSGRTFGARSTSRGTRIC